MAVLEQPPKDERRILNSVWHQVSETLGELTIAGGDCESTRAASYLTELESTYSMRPSKGEMGDSVQAVLLVGGAKLSNPLTRSHGVIAAIPIGATFRLIDIPLSNCINSGIRQMYVVTQWDSFDINSYIASAYPAELVSGVGMKQGFVDVITNSQTAEHPGWASGSADAVRQCIGSIDGDRSAEFIGPSGRAGPDDFLLLSGQALYSMDFRDMAAEHRAGGADITIACSTVGLRDMGRLGVMTVSPSGRVLEHVEKPCASDAFEQERLAGASPWGSEESPYAASMGVYMIKADVLHELMGADASGAAHIGRDVIPAAIAAGYDVRAYHHTGFWQDVAGLASYHEANLQLARADAPLDLHNERAPTYSKRHCLPPSVFSGAHGAPAELSDTLFGDGCVVRAAEVANSVVGNGAVLHEGCIVRDSMIIGVDVPGSIVREREASDAPFGVGPRTTLVGCVVDLNAAIGADCVIHNQKGILEDDRTADGYVIHEGIITILHSAVIPPGTRIGC